MMPKVEKLANGLTVAFVPCEAQSVAFGLFVRSGSRHETARCSGISHFIEHMLFKGTPTRTPLDITRSIEGRGGNFNACTAEEATCYYTHMPFEYLAEAVDIISDMYLNASIPEDEFEREKRVVIEEIKMYGDEPDSVAMENLQRSLFPKSRLGVPIAGFAKTLEPLKPVDLRRYIASHYLPSKTVAVVVGRFDEGEARREIVRRLGSCRRRGGSGAARKDDPFAAISEPETVAKRDVQQTQLALGYRTFGMTDRRRYAATVFDAVMGRGMSSRLFQEVREKRGLSYDISSRMNFFTDAGMWTVTAGVDAAKADRALKTIDSALGKIAERRVGAAELKRTKEFLVGNFRLGHERVTSKLFYYGQTILAYGRAVDPEDEIDRIRAVTAEDVQSVARAITDPANRALSRVVPSGGAANRVNVK